MFIEFDGFVIVVEDRRLPGEQTTIVAALISTSIFPVNSCLRRGLRQYRQATVKMPFLISPPAAAHQEHP